LEASGNRELRECWSVGVLECWGAGVLECSLIKSPVRIYGELLPRLQFCLHWFNPAEVLLKWNSADLHLHHHVTAIEVAAHFALQTVQVFTRIIVSAGSIDEHLWVGYAVAIPFGQQLEERLFSDLGYCIPDHVDGADSNRSFAMAARFLVGHQASPDFGGIKIISFLVDQRIWIGGKQTRAKSDLTR
jgi:hypothetical protein